MKPALIVLVGTLSTVPIGVGAPAFTTAPKHASGATSQSRLVSVHASTLPTFDRLVFRFAGGRPGYSMRFENSLLADGSGTPIPLRGRAVLTMVFQPARAHERLRAEAATGSLKPNFPTLREVARAGDFEGIVTYGAGLSKRAGFRVIGLNRPPRIVVDVAR